jgi:hypothetical protein
VGPSPASFLIQRNEARFYLEAVTPSPSSGASDLPTNARIVLEQIEAARNTDFMLQVRFVAGGPAMPAKRLTATKVERHPHPTHGRILQVELTEEGERRLKAATPTVQALEDAIEADLTPDQIATVKEWLVASAQRLEEIIASPGA